MFSYVIVADDIVWTSTPSLIGLVEANDKSRNTIKNWKTIKRTDPMVKNNDWSARYLLCQWENMKFHNGEYVLLSFVPLGQEHCQDKFADISGQKRRSRKLPCIKNSSYSLNGIGLNLTIQIIRHLVIESINQIELGYYCKLLNRVSLTEERKAVSFF